MMRMPAMHRLGARIASHLMGPLGLIAAVIWIIPTGARSETVKIGVVAPLTGGLAVRGQDIQRTLELLIPRINALSPNYQFSYRIEDGKCGIGALATNAATKFITIDRVHFLISACSGETLQIGPLAEKHKVPLMAVMSNHQDVSHLGDYVFRSFPMNQDFAQKLVETLSGDAVLPVAIISEENAFTLAFKEVVKTRLDRNQISLEADFAYDTADFRSILTRTRASHARSLFINCASAFTCAALVNQGKQLNLHLPLYGYYFLREPSFLSAVGAAAEGATIVDLPVPSDSPPLYAELRNAYFGKYPEGPSLELLVRLLFDTVVMFKEAVERVGLNPEKIKDFFYSYQAPGAAGMVRFDRNGDRAGLMHTVERIRQGRIEDMLPR